MKILILCTGNSCRSQMAEGFLRSYDKKTEVYSAGTSPAENTNPNAVLVMKELGLDIANSRPESINKYINDDFDYVITVCGDANESCPTFIGNVSNRIHIGFDDPADARGSKEDIIKEFRRIRDEIRSGFADFYDDKIKPFV
ncbi:MAG: arsenate reductase ArsC [Bacteroidales bacterium]|nr:protein tyrosine phosphatase [Lentimicrobiaceae bacterium]MDG1136565.1 arsenate reductase ArsC [Bacteroidales bacterium]MDG1902448.1 arsenate reductase ArsC [Bacteroidales bacterium]